VLFTYNPNLAGTETLVFLNSGIVDVSIRFRTYEPNK
jgi:hypothetical protein